MNNSPPNTIQLLCRRIESGGLGALTEGERRVFAINWLLVECNVGGFQQFFFNDCGKFTFDALEGLTAICATEAAEVLQRAIDLFPNSHVPVDQSQRRNALTSLPPEAQWEYFSELTAQFFRVADDVPRLVNDYITRNEELFPSLKTE